MTTLPEHARTILFNRVPEVTLAFWVIKILSTTTGETAADYLNETLGLGLTITWWIMTGLLVVALVSQFATKRYTSGVYWTIVVLISVVGTLLTDNMTDVFGVPLWVSTLVFSVLLAVTFTIWFVRERTLSSTQSSPGDARRSTGSRSSSPSRWARRLATSSPRVSAWATCSARSSSPF